MRQKLGYERLPWISVSEGATTPDPGGLDAAGVAAYSTLIADTMFWTGSFWTAKWGTSVALSTATPLNIGTATAGTALQASRGDHVHDLPDVNANVGSFTSANITVDAKGRVTAASSNAASPASTTLQRVTANVAYSTPASTAANLEANTNKADAFTIAVPANTMLHVDAVLDFTTGASTTGIAIGVNCTTNASGTANVRLNASLVAPVTNAAAATSVERLRGVASTTLNATIGTAILNTASVSPQGGHVLATLVNLGSAAVTFRIVFGTEVNGSAVTLLANSVIKYSLQAT